MMKGPVTVCCYKKIDALCEVNIMFYSSLCSCLTRPVSILVPLLYSLYLVAAPCALDPGLR